MYCLFIVFASHVIKLADEYKYESNAKDTAAYHAKYLPKGVYIEVWKNGVLIYSTKGDDL